MSRGASLFIVGLLIGLAVASGFFAWIGQAPNNSSASAVRVLRVGHGLPIAHPVHEGIVKMGALVAEYSGGKMRVEIYPAEQLGNETQSLEQVQAGTLAITKVSTGPLGNFVTRMNVFSLPYLFRDEPHYWQVLEGEIGEELLRVLDRNDNGQPTGFRGLCYYDAGSRNFYSRYPLRSPEDIRGRKFRVQNDPVAMDMVQALGGSPTPIAFGELYTALRQGVVDGAENNPPSFISSRHSEICKHYAFDQHSRVPDVLVVSAAVWDGLEKYEQEWLQRAAQESSRFQRERWKEETQKAISAMEAEGVTVGHVDTEPFRELTASVREKYADGEIGRLVSRITSTTD